MVLVALTVIVILASVVGMGWLCIDLFYRLLEWSQPPRNWKPTLMIIGGFATYMFGVFLAFFIWTCLFVAAGIVE